ncbi:hypothetical protein [Geobacter sp. SVR]|uniref:hypothetical protein n=1 Tax=Geobacter sp. SVR TaxID=2495594 RepID=UPI00143F052A|nr:hypothetical protein [Geobacter sp. SVR]BCS52737.1 lipoprotein [Geobacter sp. SVR]GCF86767.1 lipoprotein [Geobacter sp. SVR]
MKKPVIIAVSVAFVAAIVFIAVRMGDAKALNVRDVGGDPLSFTGTITITGIMGGLSQQDPSIFGIMDVKELQCKTPGCNKLFIPVKYQGTQPVLGDEVKVTGSFVTLPDGLVFAAQNVKVVRNHKIGG